MNSIWFHWSSLWGTPENPSQTELSPASHGAETTFGWRQAAFAEPSNVGSPPASAGCHFGPGEMTCPGSSWAPRPTHKAPHMSLLHSFSPISSFSSCSYTHQLSTFPAAEAFTLLILLESHMEKKPGWMGLSNAVLRGLQLSLPPNVYAFGPHVCSQLYLLERAHHQRGDKSHPACDS